MITLHNHHDITTAKTSEQVSTNVCFFHQLPLPQKLIFKQYSDYNGIRATVCLTLTHKLCNI